MTEVTEPGLSVLSARLGTLFFDIVALSNEAAPQTDEMYLGEQLGCLNSWCSRFAVWQGNDTYGFLPLHPFLPFTSRPIRRALAL
jgi:hypothetical protein